MRKPNKSIKVRSILGELDRTLLLAIYWCLPSIEILFPGPATPTKYRGYLDTGASWVSAKSEAIENLDLECLGEMPLYTAAGFLVAETRNSSDLRIHQVIT